jgi:hypothetical protein
MNKNTLFIAAWLAAGCAAAVYHFGPGQSASQLSAALRQARGAETASLHGDWKTAAAQYADALAAVPEPDRAARQQLTVAHAAARIQAGEIVEGQAELQGLVAELEANSSAADRSLLTSARNELAAASYSAAWLMRLDGATPEEWKVETERARQQYRLLAEDANHGDDAQAALFKKNLEATVKLEEMDLDTLLAHALPKKCPKNCHNLAQRKRRECQSVGPGGSNPNPPDKKQQQQDARQQVKKQRGAGIGQRGQGGS